MKNTKIHLVVFTLVIFLCITSTNTSFNKFASKGKSDVENNLSTNDLLNDAWYRTWGGSDGETGYDMVMDESDNIYIVGITESFGEGQNDIVLLKYNSTGDLLWNRTWGTNYDEYSRGIAIDSLSNVYFATRGQNGLVLVKFSSIGEQIWNKTWDIQGLLEVKDITIDSFNDIYIASKTNQDFRLLKYTSSGAQIWNRTWGPNDYNIPFAVGVDSSNNVYITGHVFNNIDLDYNMALVKYNSTGDLLWNRTWGTDDQEEVYQITVDSSDNVYLIGTILLKCSSTGVQLWNATYSGENVAVDKSGNVYIVRSTSGFPSDLLLLKFDNSGILSCNVTWDGGYDDGGWGVVVDDFNNIYVTGYTRAFLESSDIILVKFIEVPEITIDSPIQSEFYGDSAPIFDISILGSNLNTTWYTLDNGITNITFSGLSGTIDQSEWDKKGNGSVIIKFYLNNTSGTEGFAEVRVLKDIHNPEIVIINPSPSGKFGASAPNYNLSIVEPNLESMWYSIDDGTTNNSITQLTGTINQIIWDTMPYGNIILGFYARDYAGNIGYSECLIQKVKNESIPSYNLLLLISVASLVIIFLLKRKHLRNKFTLH
jgi:hypothetical protein